MADFEEYEDVIQDMEATLTLAERLRVAGQVDADAVLAVLQEALRNARLKGWAQAREVAARKDKPRS